MSNYYTSAVEIVPGHIVEIEPAWNYFGISCGEPAQETDNLGGCEAIVLEVDRYRERRVELKGTGEQFWLHPSRGLRVIGVVL